MPPTNLTDLPMRLPLRSSLLLSVLVTAGCSGSGGAPATGDPGTPATWSDVSYSDHFDDKAAAAYAKSAEFQAVDGDCIYYGCGATAAPGSANQSMPYLLSGLQFAHTAGLTGKGKTVAIVDTGFRLDHREFEGKTMKTFGTIPTLDHGTHVAGLIAAKRDGKGMMGVAPDADLHLASLDRDQDSRLDIDHVTAATLDAASLGAVAQNNSWGFNVGADRIRDYLAAHPDASVAAALSNTVGHTTAQWSSYLDAFATFEKTGVIVFASSNDDTLVNGSALASLPAFDKTLRGAWISTVNGYFEVDGNNDITDAVLISARCGMSAQFCLAGDGTTWGPEAASPTDYGTGTGTSYVAPQVSGAVALLAQAFPDLSSREWTKRLLVSADNTWFPSQGVKRDGSVDFGNGITHAYSDVWGHGLLDIKAALQPIGSLSVLSGSDVSTASRTPLSQAAINTGPAYGDGLSAALRNEDIAVFDALNGDFRMSAARLVSPSAKTAETLPTAVPEEQFQSFRTGFSFAGETRPVTASVGFAEDMAYSFDGARAGANVSLLSFARDVYAMEAAQTSGRFSVRALGFSTQSQAGSGKTAVAGGAVRLGFDTGLGKVSLGVTQLSEQGSLLGMSGSDAFDIGTGGSSTATRIGYEGEVGGGVSLFGSYEFGAARASGQSGGLVSGMSGLRFTGMSAGVKLDEVFRPTGSLSLSVSQPLRIDAGRLAVKLPTGRTPDGALAYARKTVSLEPTGRQVDWSLGYSFNPGPRSKVALAGRFSSDAGHVAGKTAVSLGAEYSLTF